MSSRTWRKISVNFVEKNSEMLAQLYVYIIMKLIVTRSNPTMMQFFSGYVAPRKRGFSVFSLSTTLIDQIYLGMVFILFTRQKWNRPWTSHGSPVISCMSPKFYYCLTLDKYQIYWFSQQIMTYYKHYFEGQKLDFSV